MATVPGNASILKAPSVTNLLSTGSPTGWAFYVSGANATVGATYTSGGQTYTVLGTVSGGTFLFASQSASPTAPGTLTKASGTGDSSIAFSQVAQLNSVSLPSSPSPLYLEVEFVGGGGGGAGSGTLTVGSGGNYADDTLFLFSSSANGYLYGPGGGGGPANTTQAGLPGGTPTVGTAAGRALYGEQGGGSWGATTNGVNFSGGRGGAGAGGLFGPGTPDGGYLNTGQNAVANTGAGGSGASTTTGATGSYSGTGGTGGGGGKVIVVSPMATCWYSVGPGGLGGAAGTSGLVGGNGADGQIQITCRYQ
jgi:hypothetical protein